LKETFEKIGIKDDLTHPGTFRCISEEKVIRQQ